MRWITIILLLVTLLALESSSLAMSSTQYALDWFVPLTSGDGGMSKSTNFAVDFIVGQTVIGDTVSDDKFGRLGYWQ